MKTLHRTRGSQALLDIQNLKLDRGIKRGNFKYLVISNNPLQNRNMQTPEFFLLQHGY